MSYRKEQIKAQAIVARAVKDGVLRPAKEFLCVDCGGRATSYDHRDYSEPLVVETVCMSCNLLRGKADGLQRGNEKRHKPTIIDALIQRYGTLRAAARVLDIPEQRMYKWRLRKSVPAKYLPIIERKLAQ